MTRAEQIPGLQAKADALVAWFTGRALPAPPITTRHGNTIADVKRLFETQVKRMEAHRANPFSPIFVNAYFELERLKIYMQNVESGTDNLPTPTERSPFGNGH